MFNKSRGWVLGQLGGLSTCTCKQYICMYANEQKSNLTAQDKFSELADLYFMYCTAEEWHLHSESVHGQKAAVWSFSLRASAIFS